MGHTAQMSTVYEPRHTFSQQPRSTYEDDDSMVSFGCFGLGRKSASPTRRSGDALPKSRPVASAPSTSYGLYVASTPEVQGYSIQGKSAEVLGLIPKSVPTTPPKTRMSTPVPRKVRSNTSFSQPKEISAPSLKSNSPPRQPRAAQVADPLIIVRRRLREEMRNGSNVRSSSAPALARNYSRKWRKSHQIEEAPDQPAGDFFDASSKDASIAEDEIPDTNKFDQTLSESKENSVRIMSAAYTTFAWMKLQEEALNLMSPAATDHARSSWLLDDGKSIKPATNTANEGKKRTPGSAPGSAGSDLAKRDDKRDTLEWMGVKPGDFPTPIPST
ncbi:uncharacterized protein PV09_04928 [Verruconis gallopava]|uniref:Uncharacterized protein n=1 Tax=Verruconis gallopava TaxID=253628 RepID=A0A0D2ABE2_9PEZI|nr:uncharacterized protein PV09_04928 [Verruconis gallopava]KIW04118.1 hypothetical protein PV09_04928 [Verruconis gallopava]